MAREMTLQWLGRVAYAVLLAGTFLTNSPTALSGTDPLGSPADAVFVEVVLPAEVVLQSETAPSSVDSDPQPIRAPSKWRASALMETRRSGFFSGVSREFEMEAIRKIGGATWISLRHLFQGEAKAGFRAGIAKYEGNFELNHLRDLVGSIQKNVERFDRKLQKGDDKGAALALIHADLSQSALDNLQPIVEQKFLALKPLYKSKRYEAKMKELEAIRVFMEQNHEISDRRSLFPNYEDYLQELRDHSLRVNAYRTAGRVTAAMTAAIIGVGITAAIPPAFGVALPIAAIAAMGVEGAKGVCESGAVLRTHFLLANQIRGEGTLSRDEIERSERRIRKVVQIGLGVAILATAGTGLVVEILDAAVGYSVFLGVVLVGDVAYIIPASIDLVKDLKSAPGSV